MRRFGRSFVRSFFHSFFHVRSFVRMLMHSGSLKMYHFYTCIRSFQHNRSRECQILTVLLSLCVKRGKWKDKIDIMVERHGVGCIAVR